MNLKIKETLAKVVQALTEVQKPLTMYRPLSADRKSDWVWTAPHTGVLYLSFVSISRTYISVEWNDARLPHVALSTASPSPNVLMPYTILVKKGDKVAVYGLNNDCYLHSALTAFVAYSFQN